MDWLYSKRCESRSECAQQARLLLKVLVMHIEAPGWFVHGDKWALQQWYLLPKQTRAQILDTILDDADLHVLSRHKCPALALETVREATLLLDSASNRFAYSESGNCNSDTQYLWLRVIGNILRHPPYAKNVAIAGTLAWALPKHMGHGMESLKALHASRAG